MAIRLRSATALFFGSCSSKLSQSASQSTVVCLSQREPLRHFALARRPIFVRNLATSSHSLLNFIHSFQLHRITRSHPHQSHQLLSALGYSAAQSIHLPSPCGARVRVSISGRSLHRNVETTSALYRHLVLHKAHTITTTLAAQPERSPLALSSSSSLHESPTSTWTISYRYPYLFRAFFYQTHRVHSAL